MKNFATTKSLPHNEYATVQNIGSISTQTLSNSISPRRSKITTRSSSVTNQDNGMGQNENRSSKKKNSQGVLPHRFEKVARESTISIGGRFTFSPDENRGSIGLSFENPQNMPKLKDLCPEDKAKVGELIKKLASEKEEKERLLTKLLSNQENYEKTIQKLVSEKHSILKDSEEVQNQFSYSLNLLKNLQSAMENQKQLETSSSCSLSTMATSQAREKEMKSPAVDNKIPTFDSKKETTSPEKKQMDAFKDLKYNQEEPETIRDCKEKIQPHVFEPKALSLNAEEERNDKRPISEISRLKIEIEELAASLRSLNFSPKKSQKESKSTGPRNTEPNFQNLFEESNYVNHDYNSINKENVDSNALSEKNQKKSLKPPLLTKKCVLRQQKKFHETTEQESSSSDDSEDDLDDIEIAKKWINMRKDKIQQMSKESGTKNQSNHSLFQAPSQNGENTVSNPKQIKEDRKDSPKSSKTSNLPSNEEYLSKNTHVQQQNSCSLINPKISGSDEQLVIDLESLDEEQIKLINKMLDSKLNQFSNSKQVITKQARNTLDSSKELKPLEGANIKNSEFPSTRFLNESDIFKEDSQKPTTLQEGINESSEIQQPESGQMTPVPEAMNITRQEKDSINISKDLSDGVSEKKMLEIDRIYEEKLREYLNIRDRMLNSLNGQQSIKHKLADKVKENSFQAKLLTNKNHHDHSALPLREGVVFRSTEIQQQSHQSVKTEDSRITASFSNAVTPVDSAQKENLAPSNQAHKLEESYRIEGYSVKSNRSLKHELSNRDLT